MPKVSATDPCSDDLLHTCKRFSFANFDQGQVMRHSLFPNVCKVFNVFVEQEVPGHSLFPYVYKVLVVFRSIRIPWKSHIHNVYNVFKGF